MKVGTHCLGGLTVASFVQLFRIVQPSEFALFAFDRLFLFLLFVVLETCTRKKKSKIIK